jgi:hypothetical protein
MCCVENFKGVSKSGALSIELRVQCPHYTGNRPFCEYLTQIWGAQLIHSLVLDLTDQMKMLVEPPDEDFGFSVAGFEPGLQE